MPDFCNNVGHCLSETYYTINCTKRYYCIYLQSSVWTVAVGLRDTHEERKRNREPVAGWCTCIISQLCLNTDINSIYTEVARTVHGHISESIHRRHLFYYITSCGVESIIKKETKWELYICAEYCQTWSGQPDKCLKLKGSEICLFKLVTSSVVAFLNWGIYFTLPYAPALNCSFTQKNRKQWAALTRNKLFFYPEV